VGSASLDPDGMPAAFAGTDGVALDAAFADIAEKAQPFLVEAADYVELFGVVIADRVVRRPGTPESRVRIYGPLEARLTTVDRVVIGGLVEGVWPPDPRSDPWRTTLRSSPARPRCFSRARPRSRARRRWSRGFFSGSPRWRAKPRGRPQSSAGTAIARWAAVWTSLRRRRAR
jgi:hypothetical protein